MGERTRHDFRDGSGEVPAARSCITTPMCTAARASAVQRRCPMGTMARRHHLPRSNTDRQPRRVAA